MVVLVEDDERLRRALARVLTVSGFQVLAFGTAEEAREGAPWATAACLVVDVRLPGMSGLDLLRWLRARGDTVPAIVMTADTRKATRDAAMRFGIAGYLEKPAAGRALTAVVREAILNRGMAKGDPT
jgi:DNA-binding response OmpR family regulator